MADWARTAGTSRRLPEEGIVARYLQRLYPSWDVWRSWPGTLGRVDVPERIRDETGYQRLVCLPDLLLTSRPRDEYELYRVAWSEGYFDDVAAVQRVVDRMGSVPELAEMPALRMAVEVKAMGLQDPANPGLVKPRLFHHRGPAEQAPFPYFYAITLQRRVHDEMAVCLVSPATLDRVRDDGRLFPGFTGDYVAPGWLARERWYALDAGRWEPYRYHLGPRTLTYPRALHDALYRDRLAAGRLRFVDSPFWATSRWQAEAMTDEIGRWAVLRPM